jgi:hypothetical protein
MSHKRIPLPAVVLDLIKVKKKLQREFTKNHNPEIKNRINNIGNAVDREIKKLQRNKWNSVFEKLNNQGPAETIFWKTLNHKNAKITNTLPNSHLSVIEKAQFFADRFEEIFKNDRASPIKNISLKQFCKKSRFNDPISLAELGGSRICSNLKKLAHFAFNF